MSKTKYNQGQEAVCQRISDSFQSLGPNISHLKPYNKSLVLYLENWFKTKNWDAERIAAL